MQNAKSNYNKFKGPSFQLDINTDVSPKKNNLMQFVNKSFSFFVQEDSFLVNNETKNKELKSMDNNVILMHRVMATNL